ncbi:Transposase [Cyclonatronum proteinivorum]|uniref:Transposase n=1 Tax=Cyclonatronum proteinivorum TaxID=1457365 RepID=A0A345UGB2_9BACT|nr:IS66 family transposase [Cyclonatronum proteinivorum]AXI99513.1 Transposase [Cyclonatronum proteinivorum]
MQITLENMSKAQLIDHANKLQKTADVLQEKLARKDELIAQLQRMLHGQKSERFELPKNQLPLPFEPDPAHKAQQAEVHEQKISYVRTKTARPNHKGRLKLPDHLPVEEVEIYPEGDLSEMVCIGKEVTEELDLKPAYLFIRRYIRYKYADKSAEANPNHIGELPERVIEKGIPGAGLLASILIDKYADHLPLYRQVQRLRRQGVDIARSTIEGWTRQGLEKLTILYDHLVAETKSQGYLQVDETRIKVLESNKKGAAHQGWYWVYYAPINGSVLFEYQPTRKRAGPEKMLDGFRGYLQTDGFTAYKRLGATPGITPLGCWAHARRKFDKALTNDAARAGYVLTQLQQLYAVERMAQTNQLTPAERKKLRLEQSLPVINELGKWIPQEYKKVQPRSAIGRALAYCINQWDQLCEYLMDGHLEIDNNPVENVIRPVALGRKNYLFAGSHEAAQRAAMIYSLLAICKKHQVDPYKWLRHTLQNISTTRYNEVTSLYPQNFKATCSS